MNFKEVNLKKIITANFILIFIFLLATILRTWDIPNRIIFFDDAAYDIRQAQAAIENKTIPLLGIPSSLPKFRQGPVTVWANMGLTLLFNNNLTGFAVFYIFLSLLALVLTYEFCEKYISKEVSIIATTLMAISPLAIAQARMPYHTNPIPLALILFLFALMRLYEKKKYGVFFAVLSWAFLFQFELAVFPTLALIPYILYRTNRLKKAKLKSQLKEILPALGIGLLPQIIYDLQNGFSQLGLFIVWVGYRVVSLFGGKHSFGSDKLNVVSDAFMKYGGRIFSTDILIINLIFFVIIIYSFFLIYKGLKKKKLNKALEIVGVFTLVLTIGYLAHGGPSEAYFPPFIILFPILVAVALERMFKGKLMILAGLLILWGGLNIRSILDHNFFVSNSQDFSYSYSVAEQKKVVEFIINHSKGDFKFDTTREIRKFESVFDNLRLLSEQQGVSENPDSKKYYYIEDKNSLLKEVPLTKVQHFPSVDVYYYEK